MTKSDINLIKKLLAKRDRVVLFFDHKTRIVYRNGDCRYRHYTLKDRMTITRAIKYTEMPYGYTSCFVYTGAVSLDDTLNAMARYDSKMEAASRKALREVRDVKGRLLWKRGA